MADLFSQHTHSARGGTDGNQRTRIPDKKSKTSGNGFERQDMVYGTSLVPIGETKEDEFTTTLCFLVCVTQKRQGPFGNKDTLTPVGLQTGMLNTLQNTLSKMPVERWHLSPMDVYRKEI